MLITIGILAYNEAHKIERTINSLLSQSVFVERQQQHKSDRWEIIVVPNGCSDQTHAVALKCLADSIPRLHDANICFRVESLTRPGKSHAWNELVHRIALPDTGVFVMMDADIEFGHVDTIHNCVGKLLQNDHTQVVVDLPLKDFTRKKRLSLFERISAGVSRINLDAQPGISGQFYCVRGSFVRQVWMPVGLSVEDGFLNAMVATDCFRSDPDHSRVVRAPDASHYFEGLVNPRQMIRHEVRLVMGTVLNCFLCWDSLLFLTPRNGLGAGQVVRQINEQNPDWYRGMMMNQVRSRGYWVVPSGFLVRRFNFSRGQSLLKRILSLPVRLAATIFDLIIYLEANRKLRSESAIGFW